jgi:O-antigen/teichoic acid export membrane protein
VLPQAYTLATSVVAARVLGAAGLGSLTFIIFVEVTIVTVLTASLPASVSRHVAEARGSDHLGGVIGLRNAARKYAVAAAAAGTAALVLVALLGGSPAAGWLFAAVTCGASILQTIPSAVLIGLQRWRQATVVGLATGFVALIAKIALLETGHGVVGMLAVDAATTTTNLIVMTFLVRKALSTLTPDRSAARDLTNRARRYALGAAAGVILTYVVWGRSEVFFLQRFSPESQIPLYSLAFSGVYMLSFVPISVATAASQAFATFSGAAGATERIRSAYGRTLRLMLLLSIPTTLATAAIGPAAFRLVYGEQYAGTKPVLLIMVATFPLVSVSFVSTAVVGGGFARARPQVLAAAAGSIVDLTLALILIPPFAAIGASIANGTAQSITSVMLVVAARRALGPVDWGSSTIIRVVAAAVTAALLALVPILAWPEGIAVPVAIVVFVAAFLSVGSVIRLVSPGDAAWGAALAGRRARGVPASVITRLGLTH